MVHYNYKLVSFFVHFKQTGWIHLFLNLTYTTIIMIKIILNSIKLDSHIAFSDLKTKHYKVLFPASTCIKFRARDHILTLTLSVNN